MKRLTARFYVTAAGNRPVREWLMGLSDADRNLVGRDMFKVELGWPIGMPVCGPIGGGLYEVRSTIADGKVEARVYFAVLEAIMFLLVGSDDKDSQQDDIKMAKARLADHRKRERERISAEKKAAKPKK